MIRILEEGRVPVMLWLDNVEEGAMRQIRNLADLPFAFHHIAIMPDCHEGYGMPIGGVLATQKVIIPNAVGMDIGCGMCAVKTSLEEISQKDLRQVIHTIPRLIPLGHKWHKKGQDVNRMPQWDSLPPLVEREFENATCQLGTLGGGNHFIEIQMGVDGHIWVMLHSGSRNIGKQVAVYYNKRARSLNEKWKEGAPLNWDLAHLPLDGKEGRTYLKEMQFCMEFAYANRLLMMERIQKVFQSVFKGRLTFEPIINIAHNYAVEETHFGAKVIVHRKGATRALKGETGIIPGSQGSPSYIVMGLGNPQSFKSCSHGAGRCMGRRQAQRELDLNEEIKRLEDQGILHAIRGARDLDEATSAYKDIHSVMALQEDLVAVLVQLSPLAVIKG